MDKEQKVMKKHEVIQSRPLQSGVDAHSMMVASMEMSYQGPLPHPEIMAGYEQVLPGAAERILVMAEKQMNHRHEQEAKLVKSSIRQKGWGMVLGVILTMLMMGCVVYLAVMGHDFLAGTLGTTTVLGILCIYVLGERAGGNSDEHHEPATIKKTSKRK